MYRLSFCFHLISLPLPVYFSSIVFSDPETAIQDSNFPALLVNFSEFIVQREDNVDTAGRESICIRRCWRTLIPGLNVFTIQHLTAIFHCGRHGGHCSSDRCNLCHHRRFTNKVSSYSPHALHKFILFPLNYYQQKHPEK